METRTNEQPLTDIDQVLGEMVGGFEGISLGAHDPDFGADEPLPIEVPALDNYGADEAKQESEHSDKYATAEQTVGHFEKHMKAAIERSDEFIIGAEANIEKLQKDIQRHKAIKAGATAFNKEILTIGAVKINSKARPKTIKAAK